MLNYSYITIFSLAVMLHCGLYTFYHNGIVYHSSGRVGNAHGKTELL